MAMVALTIGLGFFSSQHEFWKIAGFYTPLFVLYLYISFSVPPSPAASPKPGISKSLQFWLFIALLLRLLLVFSIPRLSNDFYRFIWDGRLLVQGYNPYGHLPLFYLKNGMAVSGIDQTLFEAFGAKNTYSSYPPVAQAQFASACLLFPKSIYGSVIVMKSWLFVFETGSIFLMLRLLRKFKLPDRNVLLYALNPLVIVEILGNLHFEGAMLFFLLAALWLLTEDCPLGHTSCRALSAVAFALSVCSKLLTLMFLPFFIKKMGWKESLRYFSLTGVVTALLFLPLVKLSFFGNFSESLGLYFKKLEYNASLYYLLRWVGWKVAGYNMIAWFGPALGLVALVVILRIAFINGTRWRELPEMWLFAICTYLACTTTVHPWYLTLPIALCVFTRWRFPLAWSGLIFLTYVNYSYQPYRENLWVVAIEYGITAIWFAQEWRSAGKKALSL